jgi:hypothetical protein
MEKLPKDASPCLDSGGKNRYFISHNFYVRHVFHIAIQPIDLAPIYLVACGNLHGIYEIPAIKISEPFMRLFLFWKEHFCVSFKCLSFMKLACCFFLCLVSFLNSQIIQIKFINECEEHITSDMVLIFDIDNTVIETAQYVGSDQWFYHRLKEYVKQGFDEQKALQVVLPEWVSIQKRTNVNLVEPITSRVIETWQKNGWEVMGLTSRGLELAERTVWQLQSVGIDFAKASPVLHEMNFKNNPDAIFRDGILYCSGSGKGSLLFQFFQNSGFFPKKVLFVDDKESHLRHVENACVEHQVPFVGLRYGFLDDKIKASGAD